MRTTMQYEFIVLKGQSTISAFHKVERAAVNFVAICLYRQSRHQRGFPVLNIGVEHWGTAVWESPFERQCLFAGCLDAKP